ncbi:Glucose-1-phosphate adenylyltransferase [Propionispora sp. 2/2-37]|uniref:glucose-1-phosphate adenylyltransferase n=1 Tax=Propionispora sp. 2/2-37 TaxID=1677858 RepID=UPI0006BB763E|nr:glucose-1-phosphate adenylyltransferase [Propionispora sp. 2/2-37]CUH95424.1 Glucose-1-phosphate adenylyltransferase [Propionispora sp. 2/2-37]
MRKECVAMLLAGGQGSRLGILTQKLAKPAVPFGGKYRIIDFALSNCNNSGIDTVGVLTQYKPLALNSYIGIGSAWDLDRKDGGVFVLPPYAKEKEAEWYRGTADAIYQNINFLDMFHPSYVLILSGDHIYKMNYSLMLKHHKEQEADATIAVIEVPWEEASRFGIMNTADGGRITEFEEKPQKPKSNLASMGIYIFNWNILRQYLLEDGKDEKSSRDFGKDIIPKMLAGGQKMFAYSFSGYWKDVGTVDSFWEANMDLLEPEPELNIYDPDWRIYSVNPTYPPQYIAPNAQIRQSMICEGCMVFGEVEHSILFPGVYIGSGAKIKDSVVMSQCQVEANVTVNKAIIGQKAILKEGSKVGGATQEIVLVGGDEVIPGNTALSSEQERER